MHDANDTQLRNALTGALDLAAARVDWPAFNGRLAARLGTTPRRRLSCGLVLAVAGRLAVAAALCFAAVYVADVDLGGTAPPALDLPAAVLARHAQEVRDLLNQLPADASWLAAEENGIADERR